LSGRDLAHGLPAPSLVLRRRSAGRQDVDPARRELADEPATASVGIVIVTRSERHEPHLGTAASSARRLRRMGARGTREAACRAGSITLRSYRAVVAGPCRRPPVASTRVHRGVVALRETPGASPAGPPLEQRPRRKRSRRPRTGRRRPVRVDGGRSSGTVISRPIVSRARVGQAPTHEPQARQTSGSGMIPPSARPSGHASRHAAQPMQRLPKTRSSGLAFMLSGLWHRNGQP
jgi:hypothetical protein